VISEAKIIRSAKIITVMKMKPPIKVDE